MVTNRKIPSLARIGSTPQGDPDSGKQARGARLLVHSVFDSDDVIPLEPVSSAEKKKIDTDTGIRTSNNVFEGKRERERQKKRELERRKEKRVNAKYTLGSVFDLLPHPDRQTASAKKCQNHHSSQKRRDTDTDSRATCS